MVITFTLILNVLEDNVERESSTIIYIDSLLVYEKE